MRFVESAGVLSVPVGPEPPALSPGRLAEIREHVAETRNWSLGNLAARDLLAEVDRLRAVQALRVNAAPSPSFAERAAAESDPGRRAAWRMLAEPNGEFDAYLRHPYRVGHDLPETGAKGVEPDEERLLEGDELKRAVRGHLFGGGS